MVLKEDFWGGSAQLIERLRKIRLKGFAHRQPRKRLRHHGETNLQTVTSVINADQGSVHWSE